MLKIKYEKEYSTAVQFQEKSENTILTHLQK